MGDIELNKSVKHKTIDRANRIKNPLEPFLNEFSFYQNADLAKPIKIYCKCKSDIDSKTLKWAFKLVEKNMSNFYKVTPNGWQPKVKQSDLNKNWARYLVATTDDGLGNIKLPIAYAMFRFDMDYDCSVMYCYEMQIEKSYQKKGLGRFMMMALERMTKYYNMEKLILTVLKNNEDGMKFFINLGYTKDETSPDKNENASYEILSKTFGL